MEGKLLGVPSFSKKISRTIMNVNILFRDFQPLDANGLQAGLVFFTLDLLRMPVGLAYQFEKH